MSSHVFVGVSCVASMIGLWTLSRYLQELLSYYEASGALAEMEYSWCLQLLLNLVGYSVVLVPFFIVYKYLNRIDYFDKPTNPSRVYRLLFSCFGPGAERLEGDKEGARGEAGARGETAEMLFCFCGLMGSYLVWGLLQEKIMTQNYMMSDGTSLRFSDSQLLVFVNRLLALALALGRLLATRTPIVAAPLYKFSYCSVTNIVSAWCQYEALKYVSFPTQVLSKSCKVIPVMLMGALISRTTYRLYEHVTAGLISAGMVLFMITSQDHYESSAVSTLSGLSLLALYTLCDSFTSSWQADVFQRHRVRPLQALCGVNIFSCLLTALALPASTALASGIYKNPLFVWDVCLLSLSSAVGQLLIYRTIARFGAVAFTIVMTVRQAMSILLSCLVYGHRVSALGALGVGGVFSGVLLRLYCRQRARAGGNRA